MGPTTRSITVTGGVTFEEMIGHYRVQALGLLEGGSDVLVLETTQDTRNAKAGLIGIEKAFAEVGWRVPVMLSAAIEPMGILFEEIAVSPSLSLNSCEKLIEEAPELGSGAMLQISRLSPLL